MIDDELINGKLFLFTKIYVTESAYYIGTSNIKIIFQIVLRLLKIEMEGTLRIQVIRVAGTLRIAQGTYGLSRGLVTEGLIPGEYMM